MEPTTQSSFCHLSTASPQRIVDSLFAGRPIIDDTSTETYSNSLTQIEQQIRQDDEEIDRLEAEMGRYMNIRDVCKSRLDVLKQLVTGGQLSLADRLSICEEALQHTDTWHSALESLESIRQQLDKISPRNSL